MIFQTDRPEGYKILVTRGTRATAGEALNENPDSYDDKSSFFSKYEIEATEREIDFKNYSYLLIVSMKTYLDLFSCLVDIIQNQEIREEFDSPSLHSIGGERFKSIAEIKKEFKNMKSTNKYPWISLLTNVRDRIIHRGYHLKPKFGSYKSNELNIQVHKGADFNTDVVNLEIGKLFNDFMSDMPLIEERISNILLEKIEIFRNKLSKDVSFRYSGSITQYHYNQIYPTD
jgi:hypothetical protein